MCCFRAKYVLKSALALAFGAGIYILMNRDIIAFSGNVSFDFMPDFSYLSGTLPGKLAICWGADLLWAMALTYCVQAVMDFGRSECRYLLLCILPGVLFEILQLTGFAAGTADFADIAAYSAGTLLAIRDISGGITNEENK